MSDTVLYCHTASGGTDAIKSQFELLLRFSQKVGYSPTSAYFDCNESGVTLDRPGMQMLLTDIRAGKVKRVIVKDLSRLARSLFNSQELIGVFNKYGVELISVNDGGLMDLGFARELSDMFLLLAGKGHKRRKCS